MFSSRSLFRIAIKLDTPAANRINGIKNHRRFFNVWSTSSPRCVEHTGKTSAYSPISNSNMASATSFFDFKPKDKKGQEYPLSQHKGKVVLAVNTASKCGFTPQFHGLETVWKDVKQKYPEDFVILGFPCNQFGGQDPGSDDQIQEFCQVNYGVSFPVLGKTDVNGDKAEPVYAWMKNEKPGIMGLQRIKWNFEKFLIDRDGKVVNRWASTTKPESIEKDIISLIEKTKKQ
jgi:peroxiredoxin